MQHRRARFRRRKQKRLALPAIADAFHQIDRAGVTAGEFARFGEDQFQQLGGIVLRGERHTDLVEFMDFLAGAARLLVYFMPGVNKMNVIERVVCHALQQRLRNVKWQIGINRAVIARVVKPRIGQGQDASIGNAELVVMLFHQVLLGNQHDAFHIGVFGSKLLKMQTAKALHPGEILGGKRISFKIRKDGQSPHSGGIASLWKNGGTHLFGRGLREYLPKISD